MSLRQDLLALERSLWTSNAQAYRDHVRDDAVMVFGETGVIGKGDAMHAVEQESADGRHWAEVEFADVRVAEPASGVARLTYQVTARRAYETAELTALAGSLYVKDADQWKLVYHQQTPVTGQLSRHQPHWLTAPGGRKRQSLPSAAIGATAFGAFAIGATAIGALAIGRLAIAALAVRRMRVGKLSIDDLTVRNLHVEHGFEPGAVRPA